MFCPRTLLQLKEHLILFFYLGAQVYGYGLAGAGVDASVAKGTVAGSVGAAVAIANIAHGAKRNTEQAFDTVLIYPHSAEPCLYKPRIKHALYQPKRSRNRIKAASASHPPFKLAANALDVSLCLFNTRHLPLSLCQGQNKEIADVVGHPYVLGVDYVYKIARKDIGKHACAIARKDELCAEDYQLFALQMFFLPEYKLLHRPWHPGAIHWVAKGNAVMCGY